MLPIERLLGMLLVSFCFSSVIVFEDVHTKMTIVSFSGHAKVFLHTLGKRVYVGSSLSPVMIQIALMPFGLLMSTSTAVFL